MSPRIPGRGSGQTAFTADLDVATAVFATLAVDQAEAIIAPDLVDLADGRPEVVHVLIGGAEGGIGLKAAFPALEGAAFPVHADLLVPAGAARTDPGGGDHMLDLDPAGSFAAAGALIAAGCVIRPALGVEGAGAVEAQAVFGEHLVIKGAFDRGIGFEPLTLTPGASPGPARAGHRRRGRHPNA